jgi:hypothetical protein
MQLYDILQVMREAGVSWVWWRGLYEVALRTGLLKRRFEGRSIDEALSGSLGVKLDELDSWLIENWYESSSHFFLRPNLSHYADYIHAPGRVIKVADDALNGKILFFGKWVADLGCPPDWLLNPVDNAKYSTESHWTEIPDLSEDMGDIKYVWEASRFPQAFYFVRAYALTGDERYPEGFWSQFESWVRANPIELGPHWRCGQEIAIRSFAWVFALYAFAGSHATTEKRIALMLKHLWHNAVHIEKNHWYALRCVRNNHSLSEAAGMFTTGTLFPFFPEASRWTRKGFEHLVSEAMWQIYPDGSYVQYSTNYARLVVQLFTWCTQIANSNGRDLPRNLKERLRKLMFFLYALQDTSTGRLPNYGSNDGALIFPLSSCDYLDYRPALNALGEVLDGQPLYELGPWSEEAAWFVGPTLGISDEDMGGSDRISHPAEGKPVVSFPEGGYYVLRSAELQAMIRCGKYRHRPSQADMLHFDLFYKGHSVLIDPGTYSYNPKGDWVQYFTGTQSHNTITVDGLDQMKKGSRFLWINWVNGKTLDFGQKGSACMFVGEHYGYSPVVHRRFVALREDTIVVIDYLFGDKQTHEYCLHWLLDDFGLQDTEEYGAIIDVEGNRLCLRTGCSHQASATWVRADQQRRRGWQSLYYGELTPAWSYKMSLSSSEPVMFMTMLSPVSRSRSRLSLTYQEASNIIEQWGLACSDYVIERSVASKDFATER